MPTTTNPGNGITTPIGVQPGIPSNCNSFYLVKPGDQCGSVAASKGISLSDFYAWNTGVGASCETLWANAYVCVGVVGSVPTPTSPGNGIVTPTPFQSGMTNNCKKFHLVAKGDECWLIVKAAGISLVSFYSWNPTVGDTCASLWLGYYVCVGV